MKVLKVAAVILAFGAVASWAQEVPFRLGESREQVIRLHGAPAAYFSDGRYYRSFPTYSRSLVWDIYRRRPHGREYEVMLDYEVDPNGPRLHPRLLSSEIRVKADRPVSARTMAGDLPEVAALCRPSCQVLVGSWMPSARSGDSEIRFLPPDGAAGSAVALDFSMEEFPAGTQVPVKGLGDNVCQVVIWNGTQERKLSGAPGFAQLGTWPEL